MTNDIATVNGVTIDHAAILRSLNLNPSDPKVQALLLVCERYHLDPVLKHLVLISGNAYVTRDGYLAVAHRSGVLDGIEVLEQGDTQTHYTAKVAVYRKDMSHPFVFIGRYPKNKNMAKEYGPEMAIKVAEVQALRRAFNVTGISAADEMWAEEPNQVEVARASVPRALEAGLQRPESNATATPAAPPTRRRPPPLADPETGEVLPPFDASNEKFVDWETAEALKDQARAAGISPLQLAKLVEENAPLSKTNVIKRVLKSEWPAVEAAVENYFARAGQS